MGMYQGAQEVLKYCEEIGMNTSTNHKCLVEWNDINKSQ
jgi:hypothetical protein